MSLYRYSWRPSPHDPRHYITAVSEEEIAAAPAEYDPRGESTAPSVVNQFAIGSCTANAFRTALRRALMLAGTDTGVDVSRLHIYGGERTMEGTFPEDSGAIGHDAFRFARRQGIAHEPVWPYGDGSTFASRIDYRTAQASGGKVRIEEYSHPHPDVATFKAVLASGRYICFGFPVYERLESPEVAETGILPVPVRGERLLGGHEVCIVGYVLNEGELWFLVQNSWGTDFGLGGFFLMAPEYVLGYGSSDWRCIDKV